MRSLLPADGELDDVTAAVWSEPRGRGRWIMANMVTSLDGTATVEGRSGALGGDGDREVFGALRSRADVILVGAGTVRAERYRPPREGRAEDRRRDAGMTARPVIAVVTNSLAVEPDLPLFGDPSARPLIVTHRRADRDRRRALERVAEIVEAGDDAVDLNVAVSRLVEAHGPVVLTEGGPSLLGALHAEDLIDEWCVTLAGLAAAGPTGRIATSAKAAARPLRLDRIWQDHDDLLLRYLRDR